MEKYSLHERIKQKEMNDRTLVYIYGKMTFELDNSFYFNMEMSNVT